MNTEMFRGRVALVTGSTSGIGLAVAKRLAAGGASVMINGFGETETIERILTELRALSGAEAFYDGADMTRPEEIRRMVARCADEAGHPQIVVNNAGVQYVANVTDFPEDRWDLVIAVNLSAAFHVMKAALPAMRAGNFGRIVNIVSAHGLVASPGKPAYVAAKHGMIGLTKAAALENAELDLTVNAVCPGWVDTPLVRAQVAKRALASGRTEEEEAALLVSEKQPNKRFCPAEGVAEAVVYLADPGNRFCTGSALVIDGGWTAQ